MALREANSHVLSRAFHVGERLLLRMITNRFGCATTTSHGICYYGVVGC